jgi:hypothetical protein
MTSAISFRLTHLIQQILQYYLLHRAHEFYYQGNSQSSKAFLKMITPKFLDKESQMLYRKISFRNSVPIKKLVNARFVGLNAYL